MVKRTRLSDVYRFPGFVPRTSIRAIGGDPGAVVVTLQRRRKKLSAGCADEPPRLSTTSVRAVSAICPVATGGCISTSWSAESIAPGATP